MPDDTKGPEGTDTGTAAAEPQGDPVAAPNPQDPGGSDYAAMQRTVNEFQDGTRLTQALEDRGYGAMGDVPMADELAELRSRLAKKPDVQKPSEGEFVLKRDPETNRPRRPVRTDEQFFDPGTGEFDEARYSAGVEFYEDDLQQWRGHGAAQQAEAKYLADAVKSDDAKPVITALKAVGFKQDASEDVIGVFANVISGGKPASQENTRDGLKALIAFGNALADAKIAESAAEEAENAKTEPEQAGAAGGGRPSQPTGKKSDKPQTVEEMAEQGMRERRAEQAAQ